MFRLRLSEWLVILTCLAAGYYIGIGHEDIRWRNAALAANAGHYVCDDNGNSRRFDFNPPKVNIDHTRTVVNVKTNVLNVVETITKSATFFISATGHKEVVQIYRSVNYPFYGPPAPKQIVSTNQNITINQRGRQ
jgi:hypothetical protein